MAYSKDYWNDSRSRAEKAKAWTDKMEKEFHDEIAKACEGTVCYTRLGKKTPVLDVGQRSANEKTSSGRDRMLPQIVALDSGVTDAIRMAVSESPGATTVAALNFASYKNPGGKFLEGSRAQEECLCHESFLYNVLRRFQEFYAWNAKHLNRALYENRALYTPGVRFFDQNYGTAKAGDGSPTGVCCNIITCAAPNKSAAQKYQRVSDKENRAVLENRIRFVLDIAEYNRVDVLIFGAYGCGVFGQAPEEVAFICKELLCPADGCPKYGFKKVVFPIPSGGRDKNLEIFKTVLGTGDTDVYIATADEEEPNCIQCDNSSGESFDCSKWCGAEHGWFGYRRTIVEEK